jgi:hypothetical protein
LFPSTAPLDRINEKQSYDGTNASPETAFLGIGCAILNIMVYGSPLSVMRQVIQTKSVAFMPLSLTCGTLLCSSVWGVYAILVDDWNVLVPSCLGVALGISQLVLYFYYYRSVSTVNVDRATNDREIMMKVIV